MQFGILNNTREGALQKNKRLLQKCCIAAAIILQSNEFVANSISRLFFVQSFPNLEGWCSLGR